MYLDWISNLKKNKKLIIVVKLITETIIYNGTHTKKETSLSVNGLSWFWPTRLTFIQFAI